MRLNYYVNGNKTKHVDYRAAKKSKVEAELKETLPEIVYQMAEDVCDPVLSRTVFFDHEINEESATQLRATLVSLSAESKELPIRLMLGSPGGGLYESLAIYDTIKMIPNEVVAICSGKVMSGGILILLGCDKRYSTPNTTFMIHHGHTTMTGNVLELEEQVKEVKALNQKMLDTIVKTTKITRDQLDQFLVKDHYLNAEEAKKCGLVSEVITSLEQIK
ncbi:MAG: ATP-dependent Clp protease proteolytic subunit [Lachnospiraceae bacterium]|nr:ATP-dependent Clp protease proteolytic subunit [Lachnospiraceae bacterium]